MEYFFENYRITAKLSAALAVITLILFHLSGPQARKVFELLWTLGLPLYFFFEFHWVRQNKKDEVDNYEKSQKYAGAIWVAFVTVLNFWPF